MRMSLVQFRDTMADPINRVMYQGERIVLERHGKGVAAVVSLEDLQALEAMEDAKDVAAAKEARKEKGAVPWERVKAELGLHGMGVAGKPSGEKKTRRARG
jgi:PHD/YefM family antitoxin component YafN of YafNO toxin-antitoxin module